MNIASLKACIVRRVTRCIPLAVTVIVSIILTAGSAHAQATHNCLAPTLPDSTAPTLAREATGILSEAAWGSLRATYGIPTGTVADVLIVQDNAVCSAAMAALEALSGKRFAEAFVIVRLGSAAPYFYLMTPRREGALSTSYLLDAQYALLTFIGTEG